MTLRGKVALITGSGRGIGAATAKLMASQGAGVIINFLHDKISARRVMDEIHSAGGLAIAVQADVRDAEQIELLVKEALDAYGRLDILVQSGSSSAVMKPFATMTWEEFALGVNNELQAAFLTTKAVLPTMQKQQHGRIVYIGSGLSKAPSMAGAISIGTAKGALTSFAKYIAKEYGSYGITANVVAPGFVETDLSVRIPTEQKQRITAMTPLGRAAQPMDVARVIAFFASDESGFMTGTYAPVNGGITMD